jgi:CRISPR system Cascade subunit CasC
VRCFAQISPTAKQKTFAAHNVADFVLVTKSNQALSLANAFRTPIANNGAVMENSITSLVTHYEKLVTGYELASTAIAFDITDTAKSQQITMVNMLSDIRFS